MASGLTTSSTVQAESPTSTPEVVSSSFDGTTGTYVMPIDR